MKVDLHWALVSRYLCLSISESELWESSCLLAIGDSKVRVLPTRYLIVFLCAHGGKHEWERFRWICDLVHVIRQLNEDEATSVSDLAARLHCQRLVELGIRLADRVFGEVQTALSSKFGRLNSEVDLLIDKAVGRLELHKVDSAPGQRVRSVDSDLDQFLFWLRARERRRDQVACIFAVLFQYRDKREGGSLLRVVARPFRLVGRLARSTAAARLSS
jgi:hypothetical protein